MKPLSLTLSKIGRHKITHIDFPESGVVVLYGLEDAGKTTIIRSIKAALGPRLLSEVERDNLIQDGETRGDIELVVGEDKDHVDYIIKRIVRKGGWKLIIERPDGSSVDASPQALLDTFTNDIAVNPMKYLQLTGKDLVDTTLKSFTFKTDEKYTALTEPAVAHINTEIEEAKGTRRSVRPLEDYNTLELLDKAEEVAMGIRKKAKSELDDVDAQLIEYRGVNFDVEDIDITEVNRKRNELQRAKEARNQKAHQLTAITQQVTELEAQLTKLRGEMAQVTSDLSQLPVVHDTELALLDEQAEKYANVERARIAKSLQQRRDKWSTMYETQNTAVIDIREYKKHLAATADTPVDGLSYDPENNTIIFNGKPLEMSGMSRNLKVAAAIAHARNPKLPFILVDQGGEFSDMYVRELGLWAESKGLILLVVRKHPVEGKGVVSIEIAEGEVVDDKLASEAV